MEENELEREYRKIFDDVNASADLREKVLNLKPQKRAVTPFKAVIGSVAAAVMVFCAVHEYTFEPDTEGVISETVVSNQIPKSEIASALNTEENNLKKHEKTNAAKSTPASETAETPTEHKKTEEISESVASTEDEGIMMHLEDDENTVSPVSILPRGGGLQAVALASDMIESWEISRYCDYIGTDIVSKIDGLYTGPETFEFEVDEDGIPFDDTAVLTFVCDNGGNIRITVSKHSLFNEVKNNTLNLAGNGYNAYKISNEVYYVVYTTGMTENETLAITDIL